MSKIHFKNIVIEQAEQAGLDDVELIEIYNEKKVILSDIAACEDLLDAVAAAFAPDVENGCADEIGMHSKTATEEHYDPLARDGDEVLWEDPDSLKGAAVTAAVLDVLLAAGLIELPAEDEDEDEEIAGEGEGSDDE